LISTGSRSNTRDSVVLFLGRELGLETAGDSEKVTQSMLTLAVLRVKDAQRGARDPKAQRLEVEDAMALTMLIACVPPEKNMAADRNVADRYFFILSGPASSPSAFRVSPLSIRFAAADRGSSLVLSIFLSDCFYAVAKDDFQRSKD
jgi:hypothetical protein